MNSKLDLVEQTWRHVANKDYSKDLQMPILKRKNERLFVNFSDEVTYKLILFISYW